jgi:DNA-binding transcriptional MocR family regulator
MLAIRRETVTHAMHRLARHGALESQRGRLLLDVPLLEREVTTDRLTLDAETARAS